ncbi:MAG TPA: restriction endonuclease [Planctomycetes bacterium]|nr:restriction endonuclease [Planctomycetota bacterium]
MILNLPIEAAEGYKSASQRTRVITETWMHRNMFCPACVSNSLTPTKDGTEAVDFLCARCDSTFQLKAKSGSIGRKIVDAAYDAMMRAVLQNRLPHFLFLTYNNLTVSDLLLIPNFCLPPSAIEARNPLSPTARRAGWVGCNILLDLVPPEGRIPVIKSGGIVPKSSVRKNFRTVKPLADMSVKKRGWTLDVLTVLRSLNKREFTIADAYSFEKVLSKMHPDNKNVRPKIRQQLQILRDLGYLQFISPGHYRWKRNQ